MEETNAPIAALTALHGVTIGDAGALHCQIWLDDIRRVRGFLDSFEAQLLRRVDVLARAGESVGSEDISVRCSGVSSKDAGKLKGRSETLGTASGFEDALANGDVTAAHVDQLAAAAASLPDELRGSLFDRSDELLNHATDHDPARFGRHARDLARKIAEQNGISRDRRQREQTFLSWKVAADGMYDVHARLHPLLGNRLVRALECEVAARVAAGEAAGEPEFANRSVNRGWLAAEVLVDFATAGHQISRPLVADITVLIDADSLDHGVHDDTVAETSHGAPVEVTSIRALLCNGSITPLVRSGARVLDLGRTQRLPNRHQRRALRAMYRTGAAAGCETPFDRCEIHHIEPWEHGGGTDLHNLIPCCSHHHHEIHTHRWRLRLEPDRTLTVIDRNGAVVMVTTPDMPHRPPGRSGRPCSEQLAG